MDLQTAMTPPNENCDCNECEAARVCAAEITRLRAENEKLRALLRGATEIIEDETARYPGWVNAAKEALRGGEAG